MRYLLLIHLAATLIMFGIIWVIQVVHYPLFAQVGEEQFRAYEQAHTRLITFVVFPPMTIELITSILLVFNRPIGVSTWLPVVGLLLVILIWLSTAFLQVPMHNILSNGFDAEAHRRLVQTNWIRTICWSLRTGLAALLTWQWILHAHDASG